jgi:DNA-binding transcriptional LysR family regulator
MTDANLRPDLGDLAAFAAVARHRGYRGAAAIRGVSPSTLSEAVRRLESRLGVRLLNRTTRSVTPTEAGARLLERLAPALAEVSAALGNIGAPGGGPSGTLRLNVNWVAVRTFLPPIIDAFLKAHPGVAVEVVAQDGFIDVFAAGFDAGVRYDDRLEQDMIAVPIGPRRQRYVAAAAPAYLKAHGRPRHPKELLRHACIRHRFSSGIMPPWEFERGGKVLRVTPSGPLVASAAEFEISAACAGLGLIYTFEDFLAPALRARKLVPILEEWWQSFSGPFLYYASRRLMPPPLRAFVDFLKARPLAARASGEAR